MDKVHDPFHVQIEAVALIQPFVVTVTHRDNSFEESQSAAEDDQAMDVYPEFSEEEGEEPELSEDLDEEEEFVTEEYVHQQGKDEETASSKRPK